MHLLDWIILVIFCAGTVALALHFRRRASRGIEEYFAAGRNLPWWVIGFADVAGYTGGGQGFVMVLFVSGFAGLWLMAWVSWAIWMPLVAVIWAPMWRRLGVITTGEFIEKRYAGRRAAVYRNIYSVYACAVWGTTAIAYSAAWMAATTSPVLGWSPIQVLLVFGSLTILYSLIAGLFAVAYNDVLQFVILMGGNLALGWVLIRKCGGVEHVWTGIVHARGSHFLSPFPVGSSLTGASLVALCIQGLFFAGSPFAGEGWTAQRFMAARNEWHAVMGQIANGVLALTVRLIPFIIIAFCAAVLVPLNSVTTPAALWGDLVREYAAPGLFGLLLISSIAGYMAAISSIGNWAASYLVNDVYLRSLRPKATQGELVSAGRIVSGVLLVLAFVWGATIPPESLEKWILFINSSLIVFSLPLAWLKWFWWRTNAVGDMVGILGGFPAGYIIWFGSDAVLPHGMRIWVKAISGCNLDGLIPAFSNLHRFPFWAGFGVLFVLGWVCIVAATLMTRPEPMAHLQEFYLKVHPAGLWGPVRRNLEISESELPQHELAGDLLCACIGIVFYLTLCISLFALMGGRLTLAAMVFSAAVASGLLFARMATSRLKRGSGTVAGEPLEVINSRS